MTPSETATEAATKKFPFSDDELTELAKGVIERRVKWRTKNDVILGLFPKSRYGMDP